jgi:hypothetical protein
MRKIWTIDARNNFGMALAYGEDGQQAGLVRRDLWALREQLVGMLGTKSVPYGELRRALVPSADRHEVALLFDSEQMDGWYGGEAAADVLPLLDPRSSGSILCGDVVWPSQDEGFEALSRVALCWRQPPIRYLNQVYCVYLNNLSKAGMAALIGGLRESRGCFGFVDCTYLSFAKLILSTCLANTYVRYRRFMVSGHSDDEPADVDVDYPSWPLEERGYIARSVPAMYFDLLLSYKIERPPIAEIESDSSFGIAALSGEWLDIRDCVVTVLPAKLAYLRENKGSSLVRAGLDSLSEDELATRIVDKVAASYIYDLRITDGDTSVFNIMLELAVASERARVQASLELDTTRMELNLVTLF